MNDKINNLIPTALESVQKNIFEKNGNKIPKEYKGYISSMGASIIQTGLLPTLAFFQNDESKNAKTSYLLNAIYDVLSPDRAAGDKLINYVIKEIKKTNIAENESVGADQIDQTKLYLIQEDIEDILVALKLALRTFKIV